MMGEPELPGPLTYRYYLRPPWRPGFQIPDFIFEKVLREARAAGVAITTKTSRRLEGPSVRSAYFTEITQHVLRGAPAS
jgi:hypothetical protein